MGNSRRHLRVLPLLLVGAAACGGGSASVTPPSYDLTGYWQLFVTPTGLPENGPLPVYLTLTGSAIDGVGLSGSVSGTGVGLHVDGGAFTLDLTGTATSADSMNGSLTIAGAITGTGTFRLERFAPTGMMTASGTLDGRTVSVSLGTGIASRNYSDQALSNLSAIALVATDANDEFEIELSPAGLAVGTRNIPGDTTATLLWRTDAGIVSSDPDSGTVTILSYDDNGISGSYSLTTAVGTVTGMFDCDFDYDRYDP